MYTCIPYIHKILSIYFARNSIMFYFGQLSRAGQGIDVRRVCSSNPYYGTIYMFRLWGNMNAL